MPRADARRRKSADAPMPQDVAKMRVRRADAPPMPPRAVAD